MPTRVWGLSPRARPIRQSLLVGVQGVHSIPRAPELNVDSKRVRSVLFAFHLKTTSETWGRVLERSVMRHINAPERMEMVGRWRQPEGGVMLMRAAPMRVVSGLACELEDLSFVEIAHSSGR